MVNKDLQGSNIYIFHSNLKLLLILQYKKGAIPDGKLPNNISIEAISLLLFCFVNKHASF